MSRAADLSARKSRAVARELEPTRVRSWRHRQMEKALQRRIEADIKKGKRPADARSDADEFLTEFTTQFPAIDADTLAAAGVDPATDEGILDGIGVDFSGDSYADDAAAPEPRTLRFDPDHRLVSYAASEAPPRAEPTRKRPRHH
mgnify:CR=1 FL=1